MSERACKRACKRVEEGPFRDSGDDSLLDEDDDDDDPAANENNVLNRLFGGTFNPTASFCSSEKFNTLAIKSNTSFDFLR